MMGRDYDNNRVEKRCRSATAQATLSLSLTLPLSAGSALLILASNSVE